MRIAVLSPIHWRTPPRRYGPWEWVASLITEELVRRGHDVTLFATGDSQTAARLRSVCPLPILAPEGQHLEAKMYEYLHSALPFESADEFDVIHNHYNVYPLVFSPFVRTPVVTTVEGFSSGGVADIMRRYAQTAFVSISLADRRHAPDAHWVANVYHGIPVEAYPFGDAPKEYLCFVGRIHPDKGVHEAMDVAEAAGIPLKIAGLVADDHYFKTEIQPRLRPGRIDYLGELEDAKKKALLRDALAFLHLNAYPEGFGLAPVEAMACGTPVIGMDRGSMSEVVAHGETGFVVSTAAEAIQAVAQVRSLNRRACRERVERHFTVSRMVDQYEDVYAQVVQKH
ncbi:MAG: glycosyltransferase family 4 protein [bacterium]|nr:glycosyltransferase family 4 protein [bacterium]